ncbi:DUF4767 domain-containing protein [Sesbania bispinosa]|nr:DUF4767 domain-containing protein [Sesbania bispinosa]
MVNLTDTSAPQPMVLDENPQTKPVGPKREKGEEGAGADAGGKTSTDVEVLTKDSCFQPTFDPDTPAADV